MSEEILSCIILLIIAEFKNQAVIDLNLDTKQFQMGQTCFHIGGR